MNEANLPIVDNTVTQLFRASHYSLDPVTADFMLRRVVPITIYIDGDYEGLAEVADDLRNEIARIMAEDGYLQVGEWGPFYGSYLTTIFGQEEKWESGPQVLKHLQVLSSKLLHLKDRVSPEAAKRIRVVLVVGAFVLEPVWTESTKAKKESEGKSRKANLQVCLLNSHANCAESDNHPYVLD